MTVLARELFIANAVTGAKAKGVLSIFHRLKDITPPTERHTWRERLGTFLESKRVELGVIILILLDMLLLVTEIILSERAGCNEELVLKYEHSIEIISYISLVLVFMLLFELLLLILAFGFRFFTHPMYVFDLVVSLLSVFFSIYHLETGETELAAELVVIFRVWRIIRIGHGVAMTIAEEKNKKIEKLKRRIAKLKREVQSLKATQNLEESS